MTHISRSLPRRLRSALAAAGLLASSFFPGLSQGQVARRLFRAPTTDDARIALSGTVSARVRHAAVLGHLPGETQIEGMSLMLKPSAEQQAALTQLMVDQQNPSSPQFHQWLTPQAFGERFGLADSDLAIVQDWLTSRGFTVESVAPSRNRIVFSGTATAVETAFATTLERYRRPEEDFFANSTEITLPTGLADVVSGVTGLSSYHLLPPAQPMAQAAPNYTDGAGAHDLVPWDFRQIFGINTLVSQGYDGTGITIGVIGQSAVDTTQLTLFQQKTGQAAKLPAMVLVPNSGVSNRISGDEGESELDLEYAGGTAPGAAVKFIYTGCSSATSNAVLKDQSQCNNNGVFESLIYAVQNNLAPILTLSYGGCEADDASFATGTMEPVLAQAGTQGQTVLVSTGDTGAASCETSNTPTLATGGISVEYPASSPNVSAVGGTQLNGTSSTYWQSTNNSFGGSALGYIPEVAWNDTVAYGSFASGGGGASAVFGKPSWQIGRGVPADNHRDLPDISFPAAVLETPYLICSANAPCTNTVGFGKTAGGGGLVGGTSAATPNFAAMLAVIEQANGGSALGNVNPMLYNLALGSGAGSIFHDVTAGSNMVACKGGTLGCSSPDPSVNGTMGYNAGVGYDLATGLGSMDAGALRTALQATANPGKLTATVSLGAANVTPASGSMDLLNITLSGSGATPSGTVSLSIDGSTVTSLTLSAGAASYSYTVPTCISVSSTCTHTVIASYSGDGTYNTSASTLTLTVASTGTPSSGSLSLKTTQTSVTVAAGGTISNTFTVASMAGFAGTVSFTATADNLTGCYSMPSITLGANGSGTATISLSTSAANCASTGATFRKSTIVAANGTAGNGESSLPRSGIAVLAAGLMGTFLLRRRVRPVGLLLVAVSFAALGLSGCGGGSTPLTPPVTTPPVTTNQTSYTIAITATGVPANGAANVSATSSFTLVQQ